MGGQSAVGAGVCDPSTDAARTALLSALLHERYGRPPWSSASPAAVIAHRRRILLGTEHRHG